MTAVDELAEEASLNSAEEVCRERVAEGRSERATGRRRNNE